MEPEIRADDGSSELGIRVDDRDNPDQDLRHFISKPRFHADCQRS